MLLYRLNLDGLLTDILIVSIFLLVLCVPGKVPGRSSCGWTCWTCSLPCRSWWRSWGRLRSSGGHVVWSHLLPSSRSHPWGWSPPRCSWWTCFQQQQQTALSPIKRDVITSKCPVDIFKSAFDDSWPGILPLEVNFLFWLVNLRLCPLVRKKLEASVCLLGSGHLPYCI